MKLRNAVVLIALILMVFGAVAAAGAQEVYNDVFPVAVTVTGTVLEVGDGTVNIDGVLYWLSAEVDPSLFVVGQPVTITVVLAVDVTMTVIEVVPPEEPAEEVNPQVKHPVIAAIAEAMGVEYEAVAEWSEANLGFGEIARAYLLAAAAGVDVLEIMQMRLDEGMGWGQIIKEFGVPPSRLSLGLIMRNGSLLPGVELPEDVEPSGELTSPWSPANLTTTTTETGSKPGDFGCDKPGNYCNAPGQLKKQGEDGGKGK